MATLEALLIGHEDWVHSVQWQPLQVQQQAGQQQQAQQVLERSRLVLLSASMDRSMILWRCDRATGLWLNVASVGDAGAQCLGYFGGVFSPDAGHIMAHGFTGGKLWGAASQRSSVLQGPPQHDSAHMVRMVHRAAVCGLWLSAVCHAQKLGSQQQGAAQCYSLLAAHRCWQQLRLWHTPAVCPSQLTPTGHPHHMWRA
jgi:hypothetical protein